MTQIKSGDTPGTIISWWQRLSHWPGGARLFSLGLGWMAPYSGSIGARIEEIRPGYARVSMADRRRVRNHLQSIHAIAQLNLGEIATGLAVLSTISADMRGIVLDLQASYVKKARGRLTAVAEFYLPPAVEEGTSCEVEAELRDSSDEVVAVVKATWLLGYKPS